MIMASNKYDYDYHDKKDDKKHDDDYGHHHKKFHKVIANNDKYYLDEDTTFTGNVSENDRDTKGHALDFKVIKDVQHGDLVFNPDTGAFTYTPDANFYGTDYFKYKAYDKYGKWDWAVVKLHVKDVAEENAAPVCQDDYYKVKETKKLYGDVSKNDTDADGDTLTYALAAGTDIEGLKFNSDGTFYFKPEKDKDRHNEKVTFEYTVSDGNGGTDSCHVTIYVKDNWGKKYHHYDDKKDYHHDNKHDDKKDYHHDYDMYV